MNALQDTKFVAVTPPAAIKDNASYTTASIDTKGWDYCTIIVQLGATDIAMAALKVQDSPDDITFADVDGLDTDGDADHQGDVAALPSATDDDKFVIFEIDCRYVDRYLDLVATAGDGAAGTFLSALAILSRGKDSPVSASERGVLRCMRV